MALTWGEILNELKQLSPKLDFELIGQRLTYEDFEKIFHHLFFMIDPAEAKRLFRGVIFPARNKEEQDRFIDTCVRYLNNKRLSSNRVSSSSLRMYGGEPFRRLVGTLIEAANNRKREQAKELEELEKYFPKIELPSIIAPSEDREKPSLASITKIFVEDSDSELVDYLKKYFK